MRLKRREEKLKCALVPTPRRAGLSRPRAGAYTRKVDRIRTLEAGSHLGRETPSRRPERRQCGISCVADPQRIWRSLVAAGARRKGGKAGRCNGALPPA